MTDAKPPDPPQAPASVTPDASAASEAKGERVGTILMIVGCAAVAILVLDLALKGKLLAPLFALLPAPKPKPATETPDAPPRDSGE